MSPPPTLSLDAYKCCWRRGRFLRTLTLSEGQITTMDPVWGQVTRRMLVSDLVDYALTERAGSFDISLSFRILGWCGGTVTLQLSSTHWADFEAWRAALSNAVRGTDKPVLAAPTASHRSLATVTPAVEERSRAIPAGVTMTPSWFNQTPLPVTAPAADEDVPTPLPLPPPVDVASPGVQRLPVTTPVVMDAVAKLMEERPQDQPRPTARQTHLLLQEQGEIAGDASLSTVKKACSKLTKRAVRQQPVPNKENEHRECEAV